MITKARRRQGFESPWYRVFKEVPLRGEDSYAFKKSTKYLLGDFI